MPLANGIPQLEKKMAAKVTSRAVAAGRSDALSNLMHRSQRHRLRKKAAILLAVTAVVETTSSLRQQARAQVYVGTTSQGDSLSITGNTSYAASSVTTVGDGNFVTFKYGTPLPTGAILIDGSTTGTGATNHFGSNTVTMDGGTIAYYGNSTASTTTTISNLNVQTSGLLVGLPNNYATVIAVGNLTTTSTATMTFQSQYGTLGSGSNIGEVTISNINGNATTNNSAVMIGPWATAESAGGATSFAAYGASGVTALSGTATLASVNGNNAASTTNVYDTVGGTLTGNTTVNSLASNGGDIAVGSGNTLTIASGGLIMGGASHWIKNGGNLTVGSGQTLFVTINDSGSGNSTANDDTGNSTNGNFQINSTAIINNANGAVSLVKGGMGQLNLADTSSFTGNITINEGSLQASTPSAGSASNGNSALGNLGTAGRAITINPGASLFFTTNNIMGNGESNAGNLPMIIVNAGGTLSANNYDVLGNLTLAGGQIVDTNTASATSSYQGFQFVGTVTVSGNSASTISNTTSTNGDHLGANTNFNVSSTGASSADLTISAPLRNQSGDFSGGAGALTKTGNGTLLLTGLSTYTGTTTASAGTLQIGNGTAGSISNSSAATVAASGTLAFDMATGGSYTGTISDSGTVVGAEGSSISNTLGGVISGTGGLTQSGAGVTVLSASSSYTGATLVNAGTLTITDSGTNTGALGNTSVSVAGGAALFIKGNATIGSGGATVTLAGGATTAAQGTLSLVDGTVNTLTLGGNLAVGSASGGSVLTFELGTAAGSNDTIAVGGSVSETGITSINLTQLGTLASGNYTLISTTGGGIVAADFQTSSKPAGFNSFSFSNSTSNALILTLQATPAPTTAYWTGLASSTGSPAESGNPNNAYTWGYGSNLSTPQSNWSTTVNGLSDPKQVPGAITNVYFTASNATPNSGSTLNTQLEAAYAINSITFDTSPAGTTISSVGINTNGNTLTIGSSTAGSGNLTIASTDNSNTTISGSGTGGVLIGSSQNWANNSNAQSLTVSTAINGTAGDNQQMILSFSGNGTGGITLSGGIGDGSIGGNLALVFSQAGVTQLNSAGTYSGGTTINSGTVQLGNATALGLATSDPLIFGSGSTGTLSLNGNSITLTDLNTNATIGTPIIQSSSAAAGSDTLTVTTANADTYGGVMQNGGTRLLALAKTGSGTLTLSGSNTYSGATIVSGGTLQAGIASTVVSGNATSGAFGVKSAITLGNVVGATLSLNNYSQQIGSLAGGGGTGGAVTLGSATLTTGADGTSTGFGGVISGTGGLTKIGNGTFTLSNYNTFNGGTIVSGGILALGAGGGTGTIRGNLTINSGATVNLTTGDALGYGNASVAVGNVSINGGTLNSTAGNTNNGYLTNFILTGGTMSSTSATAAYRFDAPNGNGIASLASSTTSLISAPLVISFSGNVPISVASGNTSSGIDLSITGAISDVAGIVKSGPGVLALSGANSYGGGTVISGGTLRANNGASGSATGSGNISVAAGPSGNYSGAVLGGNGTVSGAITLASSGNATQGGIIAAGASGNTSTGIGTLTSGNHTWNGGGAYIWKINAPGTAGAISGTPGTSYDELVIGNGVTSGSPLTVTTTGLAAFTITPQGNLTSVANGTYNWAIAQIGSGNATTISVNGNTTSASPTTPLSSSIFALDTSGLTVNNGADSVASNNFSLYFESVGSNNDLVLDYNAAPEPGTALLFLAGAMPMLTARRRRRHRGG